jgi:hypothetical protein
MTMNLSMNARFLTEARRLEERWARLRREGRLSGIAIPLTGGVLLEGQRLTSDKPQDKVDWKREGF